VREFLWVDAVRDEIALVPRGKHDDLSDCAAMSLIWLREKGLKKEAEK